MFIFETFFIGEIVGIAIGLLLALVLGSGMLCGCAGVVWLICLGRYTSCIHYSYMHFRNAVMTKLFILSRQELNTSIQMGDIKSSSTDSTACSDEQEGQDDQEGQDEQEEQDDQEEQDEQEGQDEPSCAPEAAAASRPSSPGAIVSVPLDDDDQQTLLERCTHTHTCTHTCIHTHAHIHMYTCTCTHAHTGTSLM